MQPSTDPFSPVVSWLINNGVVGVVCVMLLMALRVVYNERLEMQKKYEESLAQRIAERDEIVKALSESTRGLQEATDVLSSRRRP